MAERTYTVKLRQRDLKVTNDQISSFRAMFVNPSDDLAKRTSELFWLDLYVFDAEMGVSPHEVLTSIHALERGEAQNGVKASTRFRHPPLKGLWHKHFFSAQFLIQNIGLGFGKDGLDRLVNEVMDPSKSDIVTEEMIAELAHRFAHDPLDARAAQNSLTGEWIIFLKRDGENYYLCCNTHNAGDQFIYDRIVENCTRDFPELLNWLQDAAARDDDPGS